MIYFTFLTHFCKHFKLLKNMNVEFSRPVRKNTRRICLAGSLSLKRTIRKREKRIHAKHSEHNISYCKGSPLFQWNYESKNVIRAIYKKSREKNMGESWEMEGGVAFHQRWWWAKGKGERENDVVCGPPRMLSGWAALGLWGLAHSARG